MSELASEWNHIGGAHSIVFAGAVQSMRAAAIGRLFVRARLERRFGIRHFYVGAAKSGTIAESGESAGIVARFVADVVVSE
ncbi:MULTISPECIES: hypothetical protein [Burkholderia]|uniref:hypothetical protein n=1 Tax=Burkholderia TaxID=32008 RepID=UPI0012E374A7|nr:MULTISPECIES: hypothetical protein [Burkholderia]